MRRQAEVVRIWGYKNTIDKGQQVGGRAEEVTSAVLWCKRSTPTVRYHHKVYRETHERILPPFAKMLEVIERKSRCRLMTEEDAARKWHNYESRKNVIST
jgi:hypothetical protein